LSSKTLGRWWGGGVTGRSSDGEEREGEVETGVEKEEVEEEEDVPLCALAC